MNKRHKNAFRKYYKFTFEDVQIIHITKERAFNEAGCTLWGFDKSNDVYSLTHSCFSQNYKKNHTVLYNDVLNSTIYNIKYKLPVGDA